jgi:23S rRNA (pseudouridine1915-N3)-methyltransferase
MKVHLWAMGAASEDWLAKGESVYQKRIQHYLPFEYKIFNPSKDKTPAQVLTAESQWLQQQLSQSPTFLVLLDERGKQFTSIELAAKLEQWRQGSHKRLVFLIGSAYGFDATVHEKANEKFSLSRLTFPHQLCRLIMLEQLYRACTIGRGESYHHS